MKTKLIVISASLIFLGFIVFIRASPGTPVVEREAVFSLSQNHIALAYPKYTRNGYGPYDESFEYKLLTMQRTHIFSLSQNHIVSVHL
jgi:hypothetical protein